MRWTGHNTFRSATVANTAAAMLCLAITCCLIGPGMLVVIVRLFATFPHFATLGLLVTRHFACLQGGTRLAPGEAQVLWRRAFAGVFVRFAARDASAATPKESARQLGIGLLRWLWGFRLSVPLANSLLQSDHGELATLLLDQLDLARKPQRRLRIR